LFHYNNKASAKPSRPQKYSPKYFRKPQGLAKYLGEYFIKK